MSSFAGSLAGQEFGDNVDDICGPDKKTVGDLAAVRGGLGMVACPVSLLPPLLLFS
jgi:hypothetical protein